MTEHTEGDIENVGDLEISDFCTAVGALILWASMIDGQLGRAIIALHALPEHPMIEPIVAHLDARPKAELLKKRAKLIGNPDWRTRIVKWVERAEKANAKRNVVAHHGIRIEEGKIVLHSDQLGKLIDGLDKTGGALKPGKRKGIEDIEGWIVQAKAAYKEGQLVLENLERFRSRMLLKQAANQ